MDLRFVKNTELMKGSYVRLERRSSLCMIVENC
jgi:hypothetical protein